MIQVNGTPVPLSPRMTVQQYLATTTYDPARIAVERNGEIVPKRLYGETVLQEDDVLEVVSFVGGG